MAESDWMADDHEGEVEEPEVVLTESELRDLMTTWTDTHGTFMDAVADALTAKRAEVRVDDNGLEYCSDHGYDDIAYTFNGQTHTHAVCTAQGCTSRPRALEEA